MDSQKWIECNILLKNKSMETFNEALGKYIKPYLDNLRSRGKLVSWHFFREPHICFRILTHEKYAEDIKQELHMILYYEETIESSIIKSHYYGKHSQQNEEYDGEKDCYGDVWELCYKRWEYGSEIALALCTSGQSRDMGFSPTTTNKDVGFHACRDLHLFLN